MRLHLKSAIAAASLALMVSSTPALAVTPLTGWQGGSIYGELWSSSLNTPTTSPFHWEAGDAAADVWFRMYFNGRAEGTTLVNGVTPGLAASLTFALTDVTNGGKDWRFDYDVLNASGGQITSSNIRSFSFDVFPTDDQSAIRLTDAFLTGTNDYAGLGRNKAMNAGGQLLLSSDTQDICIKSAGLNNCHGGGSIGPDNGETYSGAFVLRFNTAPEFVSFTDLMVRYNAIQVNNRGDYSAYGVPYAWVPEPSTWALMILGFGAVGGMLRSRRTAYAA